MTAVAATCVVLAALAVLWPGPGVRSRRHRVLAPAPRPPVRSPVRRWRTWTRQAGATGRVRPHLLVVAAAGLAIVVGGPVASAIIGGYGLVAVRALAAQARRRSSARQRAELLDALSAAAADLRAGLPAQTALAGLGPGSPDPSAASGRSEAEPAFKRPESGGTLLVRVQAAVRLAERTGAPLAELLERIEADARSSDRARAAGTAQAAGSQATTWLLAALPAAGLGLGYAIGGDPLAVLLHTPIGAACAFGAVALQLAGVAWSRRILRPDPAVAA